MLKLRQGKSRDGNRAARDATPQVASGEIYNTRRADAIVDPTLDEVRSLIVNSRVVRIPGCLNRLRLWFLRMEKGNRKDDRTPFYRTTSWSKLVKVLNLLSRKRNGRFSFYPKGFDEAFQEVENDQLSNVGPKSVFLPWTLDGPEKLRAVMSDKPRLPGFNMEAWERALDWVASWLPKSSVAPISIEEAIKGMGGNAKFALDTNTNSGYPGWVRKWYTTDPAEKTEARVLAQEYAIRRARSLVTAAKHGTAWNDIETDWVGTTSQRTVSKGLNPLKPKNGKLKGKRIVIAMPKEEAIAGKTIMAPLQRKLALKALNPNGTSIILGWRTQPVIDKTIQKFLAEAARKGYVPLSGDISAFDASLPPWAMWDVAQAISTWLTADAAALFKAITYGDIYRTTVIAPDGVTPAQPSSVKSGSIFTSLIGCVANAAIQKYGEFAGLYKIDTIHVMGDDFITHGLGVIPMNMEKAFGAFSMECNASKQFFKPNMVHFLQRLHVLGIPGGIGSMCRIGGGVLVVEDDTQLQYDERNAYAFIFQALARLENANFNPLFRELVEWVAQGDKRYHLGSGLDPSAIVSRAGSYAERKMLEAINRPWTSTGSGVPFEHWAVNRVLRGEFPPRPGVELFEWIYGISYDSVDINSSL